MERRIVLVVSLLVAAPRARASDCPPSVELVGPPSVVEGIGAMLSVRGIEPRASRHCAAAHALVAIAGDSYTVSIEDSEGRVSARRVTSLESASTLIETWVRPELGPLAEIHAPPVAPSASRAPEPGGQGAVTVESAFEGSAGLDAALWLGVGASAGVQLGRVWLGANGHWAVGHWTVNQEAIERVSGSDGAVFVQAGWPFKVGPVRLMPSLGLGRGWWKAQAQAVDAKPGESAVDSANATFRTEAAVSGWLPLTRGLSLFAAMTAEYLPRALVEPTDDQAPEEARGYLRLAVGLRLEGP
jgi:hypothetical protein